MSARKTGQIIFAAFAALLMAAGAAKAQDTAIGAEIFRTSCAVCHGTTGQGDGEFADVLTVKPANLTKLSARNDGVFPFLSVFQFIDGRATVRAHGTSLMPIWGDAFAATVGDAAGPFGSELMVRAKIVALVDYIETLQK